MIAENGLRDALRALKLSGMLETLDARLGQARSGQLGHLEFLQVLCQDEIARREQVGMARRLRRARFEEQVTIEGFDFAANPKLPAAQIRDLAALRWLHAGESVVLYGPGVLMASGTRGYPAVGQEAFPGHMAINNQIKTLLNEGATIYACRFAMGALYGFREDDLIPGVRAFNPLDVLDSALTAWREKGFQLNTWTV